MYKSTGHNIPNSSKSLKSVEVGTVLTDDFGNLFQRAEDVFQEAAFHILWRSDDWPSGFEPVERHRTANIISGRKLYLAAKVD